MCLLVLHSRLPTGDNTAAAIIDVDSKHSLSAKEGKVSPFKRLPRILAFLNRQLESSAQGPQAKGGLAWQYHWPYICSIATRRHVELIP